MHFYELDDLLLRRWVPGQRRVALEVWNGDGWAPYRDVEHVLRYGRRLTEEDALALLHGVRARAVTLAPLSGDEALSALRDRLRRA